jgi:two-component system, OmpR family, KDP operon response regulator KdpE
MSSRLLIVDDDDALTKAMTIGLKVRGYVIDIAHDGASALQKLASQPSLVILDIGLPDCQGHEIISQMREHSKAPIILCSGWLQRGEPRSLTYAGADDYLAKPFSIIELDRAITNALLTSSDPHLAVSQ